jgi:5-formyltetrahydrofolate cyclo-ligase
MPEETRVQREGTDAGGGNTDAATAKAALRVEVLARRDASDPVDRAAWSAAISAAAADQIPAGATVSAFLPIRSEVDLAPLVHGLVAAGRVVGLPVIKGPRLIFRALVPDAPLVPRGFGTVGPADDAPEVVPDVMLVPLTVFDRSLDRIGYGKAYYDNTIAALRAAGHRPVLVGVAFALQEVDRVPVEDHDVTLDRIVTEREVILPPAG